MRNDLLGRVERGVASLKEFRREWAELYGAWDDEEPVWVVEFEHLGPDRNP